MNDDGSGSMAVLELALQAAVVLRGSRNRLRFCWWAAEEEGLLGSIAYFEQLSPAERAAIQGQCCAPPWRTHSLPDQCT